MIVIPENLPAELAPLAWMLGSWKGWGMLAVPAAPQADKVDTQNPLTDPGSRDLGKAADDAGEASSNDLPVIESIECSIVGTQMRMVTSVYAAEMKSKMTSSQNSDSDNVSAFADPLWDAVEGLQSMSEGELLWQSTEYFRVLPGTGELPPPGEYLPREFMGTGSTTTGLAPLWAGIAIGPRIQMVTDALAREATAEPVEQLSRLYGLVSGEMMWTQERAVEGEDPDVQISGRLARIGEGTVDVSEH